MSGVGGVTNANRYDDREIDSLKDNEKVSTNAAINRLANHAGAGDVHILHGVDKTEGEIRAEHRDAIQEEWLGADLKELGNVGAEHLVEHFGSAAAAETVSAVMLPFSVIKGTYEMMNAVGEDGIVGHERAAAMPRDAMHVMILGNLNGLPQGYADQQRARFSKDALEGGFTQRMTHQLGGADNTLMAIMQLHCDQGMNAARAMVQANQTPSEYLAAHPDVAQKFQRDPAFHHGFNGMVFAHDNGQYAEVVAALDARDARYEAHHIAVRG